jgi:DMSO/TMAO reductase YedYZ molybdopterin-dependent catalytic subunit
MASTKSSLRKKRNSVIMKNNVLLILATVIILVAFFLLSQPKRLDYVEVTEYQGQDLSSINDFRENSIKGPQYINIENYTLIIEGLVDQEKTYTYDEVLDHENYEKVVTLNCVEGWSVTILWEGVLLKDLLDEAGINPQANTVIFYAHDGYSSSLPLDYIIDNNILLAYKMNGVTLPPERGFPFQLVAESKLGYKWVKWITSIELSDDKDYRGFWESRGYSNEADIR